MSQLYKRFTSEEFKGLLERYLKQEIERNYIQEILGIKKEGSLRSSSSIKNILKVFPFNTKGAPRQEFL
ncbi:MAG: hypothetical protein ACE144_20130 [Thermodesulfobacteriota bacterium]